MSDTPESSADCTCLAVRQAARHLSQFYDQHVAPFGLRATQFSILSRLNRRGPLTINALAEELVMDRTTVGRNILPLEREGLIRIVPGRADRRVKELHLSEAGFERLSAARKGWLEAQRQFTALFGQERSAELRALARAASSVDLPSPLEG